MGHLAQYWDNPVWVRNIYIYLAVSAIICTYEFSEVTTWRTIYIHIGFQN